MKTMYWKHIVAKHKPGFFFYISSHPSSTTYLGSGRWGSSLSREAETLATQFLNYFKQFMDGLVSSM